jgi:DNA internalization-related competence protein ComEC/Rec2
VWTRTKKPAAEPPATTLREPPRRPLIGALLLFAAGTLTGLIWTPPVTLCLCASLALLALAAVRRGRPEALIALWLAWLLTATAYAAWHRTAPFPHALEHQLRADREQITLIGRVSDDPMLQDDAETPVWRFRLRLEQIERLTQPAPAHGEVDVFWQVADADSTRPPRYGDRYRLTGIVHQRADDDWTWAFLPRLRCRIPAGYDVTLLDAGGGSPLYRFSYAGRRIASERLAAGLTDYPDVRGILQALLLGYRGELPDNLHRLFAQTGTLHIFAISGLHVGIVAGLLILIVRAAGLPRTRWLLAVGPLLILYTIATGLRPSAIRACVMALAFFSATLVQRRPDPVSAWALAGLVILCVDPTQLVAPGFLFSFIIVAGLIRLYPIVSRWFRIDATLEPYDLNQQTAGLTTRRRILRWLAGLAAASVAAWLSSAPLTAYYFGLVSPIALLGNLLVIPAAFLIVLSGLLAIVAGGVASVGAEIFNHANRVIIQALIAAIDALAAVPGGYARIAPPALGWVLYAYGWLFGGLLLPRRVARRRLLIALYAATGLIAAGWQAQQQHVTLRVLAVGDGEAVLIQAGNATHLWGTGPEYRQDRLLQALQRAGVDRLDTLILPHAGRGHIGGALALLETLPVRTVWYTDYPAGPPAYQAALAEAAAQGIPLQVRRAGDQGRWPGDVDWQVLHPAGTEDATRTAAAALVLRVSHGAHAVLLTSGADGRVERALRQQPQSLAATVWISGNEGVTGSGETAWLERVRPQAVVLSVGAYNRRGYPDRALLDRLAAANLPGGVWRTDRDGRVRVTLESQVRGHRRIDRWQVEAD